MREGVDNLSITFPLAIPGVPGLVRFDPRASDGRLRIWDCIEQDLVERRLRGPRAQSRVLPGFWLSVQDPATGPTLRLAHDELGARLYPSPTEQAERLAEQAQQRTAELEAELAKRR
jgi:hypothetical protein